MKRDFLAVAAALVLLTACSTAPRVVEVSSHKRLETVEVADQGIFLRDRASLIHFKSTLLPRDEKRQEFFVHWSGTDVNLVKFEYRQANVPDKILEQSFTPSDRRWNVFEIRGDDFLKSGPVSAWRVSLWQNSELLAERKSMLW